MMPRGAAQKTVLVVDDDRDVADIVQTILVDEGFRVSSIYTHLGPDVRAAVEALRPDCVLLDGGVTAGFDGAWETALSLFSRPHPVPVVMVTGDIAAREEAMLDTTERAKATHIAAVITKPFDIDHLITVVRRVLGEEVPVARPTEGQDKTELVERLRAAGALGVSGSKIGRVWANFKARDGGLYTVYRWRAADVYFVARYDLAGKQLEPLGQFSTLESVIAFCVARIQRPIT